MSVGVWPQILAIVWLSIRTIGEMARSVNGNPQMSVAVLIAMEMAVTAAIVTCLGLGGFWAPLGWSP